MERIAHKARRGMRRQSGTDRRKARRGTRRQNGTDRRKARRGMRREFERQRARKNEQRASRIFRRAGARIAPEGAPISDGFLSEIGGERQRSPAAAQAKASGGAASFFASSKWRLFATHRDQKKKWGQRPPRFTVPEVFRHRR